MVTEIAATERSPAIRFDYAQNDFLVAGESYPEDVNSFFGPLMETMETHLADLSDAAVKFVFELQYFNSSSAKVIMRLFDALEACAEAGNDVTVIWRHDIDDDNMQELGEEFGEDLEAATFALEEADLAG